MSAPANIINHVVLVLDASSSMQGRNAEQLVKVADSQVAHLAQRSQELDQETRVTVYQFGSDRSWEARHGSTVFSRFSRPPRSIECLIYDKDVLRMPSIAEVYHAWGNTPLIDATWMALADLAMTPEKYGEHSFLVYVLTDGKENDSAHTRGQLASRIAALPENWTLAAFVPDSDGRRYAENYGFPRDNIAVWNTTSSVGVEEVGEVMRTATENFMQARRTGVKGTKALFNLAAPKISQVKANLDPLRSTEYDVYNVGPERARIDEFVEEATGKPYVKGNAFYQLSKRETVQASKQIAIMGSKGVYTGRQARDLLGLPDFEVKVDPAFNKDYDVFVQSTSVNRNLMPNTKVLVLR